ncbi:hypothetical protein OEZ49_18005 [Ruegeria sp. WL0004]|uniref:Uncharacterized protein n=1 Tax=Ruegeria marisflavi TaxID=2984152 RepID=A0ABT2WUU8_9RHOB|nr:hypothetical protein [Ruegeria sp. WL0004]MCU9839672.1 hypothetical protein [Ruegeria sp. WL0004]
MKHTKWVPPHEYYKTGRDPLRGKRRLTNAEHGNAVRDEIAKLMPVREIAEAVGSMAEAMEIRSNPTGKFSTIRIRADLIGFLKALRIRHQRNTGDDISLPNIVSLMALHGMHGVLEMPEFARVSV